MIDELRDSTLALQHFYDIEGVERRTALGTVFAAREQPFDRPVSVWVLDRLVAMGADPLLLDRFETLAYTASRLAAPSAVRTLDVGRIDPETPFVVMERLEGRDLRQHLAVHGPLDVGATLRVVEQLVDAISDAHRLGIQRLGLDAARVRVVDPATMQVRVWGLGMALSRKELLELDDAIVALDLVRHLPPSEFAATTPLPPESPQDEHRSRADDAADADDAAEHDPHAAPGDDGTALRGGRTWPDAPPAPVANDESPAERDPLALALDPAAAGAADLYALAAIAYECLSGHHPYFREDRDVGDGVLAILRESPAALHDHFAAPQAVATLIHAALGRDPRARFDTVGDFAAALRAAASDEDRARADLLARPAWLGQRDTLSATASATATRARKPPSPALVRVLKVALAVLLVGNVITGLMAIQRDVRSYAEVPEFAPPAPDGEGVDVVIVAEMPIDPSDPSSPASTVRTDLYRVSTRGEMVHLGQTPFVLRSQSVDSRLHLVLSSADVKPRQLEILVQNSSERTQLVRERVAPLSSPLRPGSRATAMLDTD